MKTWAIIGCGRVAPAHVTALRAAGSAQLVGVVDTDPSVAKAFGDRFGLATWPSVEALIEAAHPDAATIALPHHVHVPVIEQLLAGGVSALSEKPLARTAQECSQLVDAEQASGVPIGTILNMRRLPYAVALHDAVASGRLNVRDIEISGALVRRPENIWQTDPSRAGGGILLEVGIHFLDLCHWWFGPATSGSCTTEGERIDHSAHVEALFGDGVPLDMDLRAVYDIGRPVEIIVTADEGVLRISGARVTAGAELLDVEETDGSLTGESAGAASPELPYGPGHLQAIGDAADMFDALHRFPVSAREGAVGVALVEALYSSAGSELDLAAAISPFVPSRQALS